MNPGDDAPTSPASGPGRRRWQLGLRAVILLVVAAALASSIEANRRRVADLARRIDRLRPLARELDVADPRQLAAIERLKEEPGEEGWDVHVPDGRAYRLCLATRGIDEKNDPEPRQAAPLGPGRHTIRLATRHDARGSRFEVRDGRDRRLAVEEPKGWVEIGGSSSSSIGSTTMPSAADRPFILLRRRFMKPIPEDPRSSRVPDGPTEGVMLWIEPADGSTSPQSR